MADANDQRPACRVAYLVSAFPAVSHTFIARELDALRARGVDVVTMSIRKTPGDQLLSAADQTAADETFSVFPLHKARFAAAHLRAALTRPGRYFATLRLALAMSGGGLRATLWQLFYFAESILIWSECRQRDVRHIHAHFANVASAVALLAAEFGQPDGFRWSFTMHGYTEFDEVRRYALAEKVRRAAFTACISDFCRSQLLKLVEPEHWDKLSVVRCGLDGADVRALPARGAASEAATAGAPVRLLFVGRLVPEKGVLVLLRALATLRQGEVQIETVLVGDGPYRDELERAARRLGVAEQLTFTGALTGARVAPLYREADVFCLPSFAEGLPVVLMEAMANELPVVTSRIAGIAELVDDGANGVLLPPGRDDVIADALARLAADPELRARWGRAGRERVLRDYDVARSAELLESLFTSRGAGGRGRSTGGAGGPRWAGSGRSRSGAPAAGDGRRHRLKAIPGERPQQVIRVLALERRAPQAGLAGHRVLSVERHGAALVAHDDPVALCRLGDHPDEPRQMQRRDVQPGVEAEAGAFGDLRHPGREDVAVGALRGPRVVARSRLHQRDRERVIDVAAL